MGEFYSVMKHLGFRVRNALVNGYKCSLLSVRSNYLFKNESDWKAYMLDVSKDTVWEPNFRAFLLGEDVESEEIPAQTKSEIEDSAILFLDTEKGDNYGRG